MKAFKQGDYIYPLLNELQYVPEQITFDPKYNMNPKIDFNRPMSPKHKRRLERKSKKAFKKVFDTYQ